MRGAPRGALRRSLGAALGPSFGSLCLASWLLNLLQMLKSMAENARNDNRDNICLQLLMSCFEFLISVCGEAASSHGIAAAVWCSASLLPAACTLVLIDAVAAVAAAAAAAGGRRSWRR